MKEIEDIVRAYKNAIRAGKQAVLATVVHVEGSSYRRPGARMLVTEDGELTGAISGGCLEGDALRKALLAISQQQNKLVTYDSMDEEDSTIGIQLGCNGIVHILFELIDDSNANNPIALLEKIVSQTAPSVLVTLFSINDPLGIQPGTCLLSTAGGTYYNIKEQLLPAEINKDIENVFESGQSQIKPYFINGLPFTGFTELVQPPVELVIAGAGNDAFPLVEMAAVLGWHITVVDGRKTHANERRFPTVKNIIVGKTTEVMQQLVLNKQTAFVLMSHNYNYDLGMLKHVVDTDCNYIGVLGPKKKLEKMLAELVNSGVVIPAEIRNRIYGPVGLDIGAETAEEIALSILSEIKTVFAKKDGVALHKKPGFIHDHNRVVQVTAESK